MRNLVHGIKEKTPMGFCDVPRKNLLDFFRDMKSISVPNKPRYKPLKKIHRAASEGDVKRLQKMICLGKHSVHDRDFKQRTALHFACAYGKVEAVSVLLRNNCDIDAVDRNSITPLMKAVQNWTYGCVHTLLKHGADPNHMDKNGNTSLHYAVSEDNRMLAKYLLKYSANMEQKNKDGFTPLLLALKENKIEMAKFLVKKGANIHVFDEMKRNTLLYAIRWDAKDMVSLLLKEGIDFFFKDVFGWTALRYAIEGTSKGSRKILMDYDEKLRIKNKDGSVGKAYENEYKNSEENSLAKNTSDPTSVFTLPKSNDDDDDFNDKVNIEGTLVVSGGEITSRERMHPFSHEHENKNQGRSKERKNRS
ncbi:ankyrin repeat domain-containing protein 7-like [Arvicola amphibius]|uniref:ankyrin repeat domain-containing protein 7-like n=1 Tax=Arvicola amphibius TaxID=1047088 RepID=UPI001C0A3460|nr:ankyrin repeat domain-containing protein 7-like [Arvicola amphibius]